MFSRSPGLAVVPVVEETPHAARLTVTAAAAAIVFKNRGRLVAMTESAHPCSVTMHLLSIGTTLCQDTLVAAGGWPRWSAAERSWGAGAATAPAPIERGL